MALQYDADVEDDWRDSTVETQWDGWWDPDDHPAPPLTDEDAPPRWQ